MEATTTLQLTATGSLSYRRFQKFHLHNPKFGNTINHIHTNRNLGSITLPPINNNGVSKF